MAFAEDRLDLGQVEHGGLQAGNGPGQGGGVGAGAAADVEQPPRPGQPGQGGQLAPEPGGQVVQGAEEVEGAARVGGEALAPGRDAGVAVADAVGQAGPGPVEEPSLATIRATDSGWPPASAAPSSDRRYPAGPWSARPSATIAPSSARVARGSVPQAAATAAGRRRPSAMASATPLAQAAATTADCW
jgi:hypothetical protein